MVGCHYLDYPYCWLVCLSWSDKKRESETRVRTKVDEIISKMEDIERDAVEFWQNPGSDKKSQENQRRLMILKLEQLETRISNFSTLKFSFENKFNNFFKAVLDGDGESLCRSALSDNHRFNRILDAAKVLKNKLSSVNKLFP